MRAATAPSAGESPERACRCADDRAGRHRIDQSGSGTRGHRAERLQAVRRAAARGDRGRRGRHGGVGAERAAEDARRAARRLDLRAGDVAARSAAADGQVALPASPVRAAGPSRHCAGADARSWLRREGRARRRGPGRGSLARALEGDTEAYVEARQAAVSMLGTAAHASSPVQRLAAARALGRDKVDRDELGAACGWCRRCCATSACCRPVPRTGACAQRPEARAAAPASAFEGDRAVRAFSAVAKALDALDRNASPKIVADWLAFQV